MKPLTMAVEKEREYRACCTSGGTEVDPVFAELDATRAALAAAEAKLAEERRHAAAAWRALEETRCTCEAVILGGMPSRLRCVRCRTLEAHAARRAAEKEVANDPR